VRISEHLRALTLATSLATLSACTATVAHVPAPIPTGTGPTVKRVLEVLDAQDKAVARFRAQAKLDYRSPEQSFRSTQVVVVRGPSSARIDVMNPFGVSYSVATDGKRLTAYDRRQGVYYQGLAQAESFRRFIGIPMGSSDFAAVLRGLPPGIGDSRWSAVVGAEGGWLMRRRLGSGGVLELVVDATTFLPVRVKISGDRDRHEVEVTYGDYRDVEGVSIPHLITVSFKDGSRLELAYKSVQRNILLREDAFRIDRPAGARFVNIDTGGGGVIQSAVGGGGEG
jgi:outer membrane lipoprotein-sorting protein